MDEFDTAFRPVVAVPCLILLIVAMLGIIGHMHIILVFYRSKSIDRSCSILVIVLALDDIIHQLAPIVYLYSLLSQSVYIDQLTCFWSQLFPATFMLHSIAILFVVALDRFFAVFFTRIYVSTLLLKLVYTAGGLVFATVYAVSTALVAYEETMTDPDQKLFCLVSSFFAGNSAKLWADSVVLFSFLTCLIYVVIWVAVWKGLAVAPVIRRTLKPFTAVLLLTLCGWFSGMLIHAIVAQMAIKGNQFTVISAYTGIIINASIAANVFVYCLFSREFGQGLLRLYACCQLSSVSPMSSTPQCRSAPQPPLSSSHM